MARKAKFGVIIGILTRVNIMCVLIIEWLKQEQLLQAKCNCSAIASTLHAVTSKAATTVPSVDVFFAPVFTWLV